MTIQSINPATGELLASYTADTEGAIAAKLSRAGQAFEGWRHTTLEERARYLRAAAASLRRRRDEFALLMAREMGKPVLQARAEIEKCAGACEHYADHAAEYLEAEPVRTDAPESFVCYEPLGLVLAIMPWNFPFWQVFRFAAPALMAGNACVLKHAPNVSGCALAIAGMLRDTGLPEGLFTVVLAENEAVEPIIASPLVRAVTLTGSCRAGSAVASAAGRYLKKSVLELGGSDAYLVLADADLGLAARVCAASRMANNGQVCIAAKRLIVERSVMQPFQERLLQEIAAYRPGNPELESTNQGPMARADLRSALHRQVELSISEGARCLLGGEVPEGPGFYYPATVLADVRPGMTAFREELFGPVASLVAAADEADAIRLANDSEFGLGAAVFSRNIERAREIAAHQLEAGTCVVNDMVRSDPRLPFGGVKNSGYGRELAGHGIREFVNIKTVYRG